MNTLHFFHGPNSGYFLELYDKYLENPTSIDSHAKTLFDKWKSELASTRHKEASPQNMEKIVATVNLTQTIRAFGHLGARINPLNSSQIYDSAPYTTTHNLTEEDLCQLPSSLIGGKIAEETSNALEAIRKLRAVYSSTVGYDYYHIYDYEEREWLRDAAESGRFRPPKDPINERLLLDNLTKVEVFERFLHSIFPGKFRFSIEGVDMLVPMLNEIVGLAAESGTHHILLGMAHRGRLNVMHHVTNKDYKGTLIKFKDPVLERDFQDDMGWTGDVKYHEGARHSIVGNGREIDMEITLAPNPSHLESVNPVVEGMCRAAGTRADNPGAPEFDPEVSIPIIVHGDAAFPGQGIVSETLNLSRLDGYTTGGTIHIITNNQIGYTTLPSEARSTLYSSDLARGFEIPIVHANADDPEACIETARLAFNYLKRFQKDFLIDLVGYRRHGHNEADEPNFTQPEMYEMVENHPTVREIWSNTLIERNIIKKEETEEILNKYNKILHKDFKSLSPDDVPREKHLPPPVGAAQKVKTAVSADKLRELNDSLLKLPQSFSINPKIKRGRDRRVNALNTLDQKTIDWATAEDLAFASILADGTAIRLTGQDTQRGTFSHRHAVLHDSKTGNLFTPLQNLPQAKASFEVHNSPLTENACIGFEYGYNVKEPKRLVIWEAQYGDFINGAQTIVDEFLVSARAKWGQTPSLVLLLPHAYEGQGPDHSSGRITRFLGSAAEINMRIANCTTSAQYFHLLRRQAEILEIDPLPLIVLTPKSLLRNPQVHSSLKEFSEGAWQPVIDDARNDKDAEKVKRLILCSGKVYIDLIASKYMKNTCEDIAIARVEQLYSIPKAPLTKVIKRYVNLKEVVWLQEEPETMGAWMFMFPFLRKIINKRVPLHYMGRRRNSSPAEGSLSMHKVHQEALIRQAFMTAKLPNIDELGVTWVKNV